MEYVYVMEFPDCVKIGYSTRIDSRIKQVEAMEGRKATNIYYTEATRDTENAMHRAFESRRVKGEFFSVPFGEAKETLLDVVRNPEHYKPRKKTTKAQQKAVSKYMKENYDMYQIRMPKGKKETIQTAAAAVGQSINAYINQAIDERMERDNPSDAAQKPTDAFSGGGATPDTVRHGNAVRGGLKWKSAMPVPLSRSFTRSTGRRNSG